MLSDPEWIEWEGLCSVNKVLILLHYCIKWLDLFVHRPGCVKMRDNLACRSEKLVPVDVNLGIGYSFWDSVDDTTVYTGLSRFALSLAALGPYQSR